MQRYIIGKVNMNYSGLGVVFTGNFNSAGEGAGSQRVFRIIEALQSLDVSIAAMISNRLVKNENNLPIRLVKTSPLLSAIRFICQFRRSHEFNVFYVYDGIDFSVFPFVILARLLGYRIVVDVVEDYGLYEGRLGLKTRVRHWSMAMSKVCWKPLGVLLVTISTPLFRKYTELGFEPYLLPVMSKDHRVKTFEHLSKFRIVYAGGYDEKDGVRELVKAFGKFDHGKIQLLMTGNRERFEKLYPNIDASGVDFLGFLPENEYWELLQSANLLVAPRSNSAYAAMGFPFKVGEYLSTGRPVLVSRMKSIEGYLDDGDSCLIFRPGDAIDLMNKILWAYENRDLLEKIGTRGYLVWKRNFDPSIVVPQFFNSFRKDKISSHLTS